MADLREVRMTPSDTNEELVDDQNEGIIMEFAKEKYFHGRSSIDDLSEVLKNNGDFVVRSNEDEHKKEIKDKPLVVSVKWNSDYRHFPIYFFKTPDGNPAVSFEKENQKVFFRNVADLIREAIKNHTHMDAEGTQLLTAIERQVQELKRADMKLESLIGEGSFGTVHSGKYILGGNTFAVAIKITKFSLDIRKVFEEMLSEAKTMSKLQHPNVIRFFGMTMGESDIWIVMELVNGGSLDKFLLANQDLSCTDKWAFAYDCAKGLSYLHNNRILHRDVAARNCLVDSKAGKHTVKISDFGMSAKGEKYRIEASERTPIKWQAPEVLRTGVFNKACDVWGFGCCVYEIFTGKTPFYDVDNKTVREKLVSDPNFRPSLKEFSMIPVAVDLMRLTWRDDPQKRLTMRQISLSMPKMFNAYLKSKSKNSNQDLESLEKVVKKDATLMKDHPPKDGSKDKEEKKEMKKDKQEKSGDRNIKNQSKRNDIRKKKNKDSRRQSVMKKANTAKKGEIEGRLSQDGCIF